MHPTDPIRGSREVRAWWRAALAAAAYVLGGTAIVIWAWKLAGAEFWGWPHLGYRQVVAILCALLVST